MRVWPFSQIAAWVASHVNARTVRPVATWDAYTNVIKDSGERLGIRHTHIVTFTIDGNGKRSSSIVTSHKDSSKQHGGVVKVRSDWIAHGRLPVDAERFDNRPRGRLVSISGGKPAA